MPVDGSRWWFAGAADNPLVWIERISGSASALVGQSVPDVLASALVQVCGLSRTALILGSAQKESIADLPAAEAAGVDVARRRSGGGAVLLAPGRSLWIDVLLPRDDPRWSDDVVASSVRLGDTWGSGAGQVGWRGCRSRPCRSPISLAGQAACRPNATDPVRLSPVPHRLAI